MLGEEEGVVFVGGLDCACNVVAGARDKSILDRLWGRAAASGIVRESSRVGDSSASFRYLANSINDEN